MPKNEVHSPNSRENTQSSVDMVCRQLRHEDAKLGALFNRVVGGGRKGLPAAISMGTSVSATLLRYRQPLTVHCTTCGAWSWSAQATLGGRSLPASNRAPRALHFLELVAAPPQTLSRHPPRPFPVGREVPPKSSPARPARRTLRLRARLFV